MDITPITISEAQVFVTRHHRHHKAPVGGLFALAVSEGEMVVAVAVIGRPVARAWDDGWQVEVTRLCTLDGSCICHAGIVAPKGAASKLYARCAQIALLMGYRRVITYIGASEKGTSLQAAGWRCLGQAGGGSWSVPSRPRVDKHPLEQKTLWQVP